MRRFDMYYVSEVNILNHTFLYREGNVGEVGVSDSPEDSECFSRYSVLIWRQSQNSIAA